MFWKIFIAILKSKMTTVQEYLQSPTQHPHEELALRVPMSMSRAICRIFAFPQKRNF